MRIAPFSTPGRFWRGNLHTHCDASDGALSRPRWSRPTSAPAMISCSSPTISSSSFDWPIADTRAFRSNNFTTLIGAELHAMGTEVGELWHILAAGLPLEFAPPSEGETGPELAARARAAGAFVAIAHPAWSQLRIGDGRALAGAHAVEIYNHGCAVETDRGDGFYLLDELLDEGRRLTAIATDDAHFKNGDYDAFGGFVEVKAESLDPDALLAALKAGQFYSSQGPRLLDVTVSPEEVGVVCSPVHSISLLTGTSRALSKIGRHRHLGDVRNRQRAQTGLGRSGRAAMVPRRRSIDAAGRRAWTNPIWLDELG